ncbi:hypothetical protein Tco_0909057 [Tanacetum coccineum]|uniref:Uncharacterized protein n=1 Tax=Tanacetum coccineum TaxID=301880 RepID=A0ABQ5CQQ8_9ASTR
MAVLKDHLRRFSWHEMLTKKSVAAIKTRLPKPLQVAYANGTVQEVYCSLYPLPPSKASPTATPDQIDDLDLEEMDINWQIAMTAIKIKKFYKKTGRRPRVDGRKKCMWHLIKRKGKSCQINWVEQTTDEELNHALMAFTVNNEKAALVAHKSCKKLESQLKASHKQQSSLTEKLNFQANQIFEKDEKLKKYRRIGMKAVKDKDALQQIFDSWSASSKNLWKLIDCGMSSTVKIGLGYGIKSNDAGGLGF